MYKSHQEGAPRRAPGLAGVRHRVELPELRAGVHVVGADEAAVGAVARAPLQPLYHLPLRAERAARLRLAHGALGGGDADDGDFSTGETYTIETVAPTVQSVSVNSALTVDVTFDEAMESTGVTTAASYAVSGSGQGTLNAQPDSVALQSGNTYRLTWNSGEMRSGGDITITPGGAAAVTLRPGDAFVVEPGFKGTWKIEKPVRKHFCIKLK